MANYESQLAVFLSIRVPPVLSAIRAAWPAVLWALTAGVFADDSMRAPKWETVLRCEFFRMSAQLIGSYFTIITAQSQYTVAGADALRELEKKANARNRK